MLIASFATATMEELYKGKFLNLVKEGRWEYCERVNNTAAVMIFALTPQQEVLLVEEFRPPIGMRSLCFPAGLSGDEGPESHAAAAVRELQEETGFAAGKMRYLFTGPSSPGLTSETLHFYLASDLQQVGSGGGVEGEQIVVHRVPWAEIESWLQRKMKEGVAVDPRVYAGLWFLKDCLK